MALETFHPPMRMHIDAPSIRGSRHSVMAMSAFCLRSGNGSIKGAVCSSAEKHALPLDVISTSDVMSVPVVPEPLSFCIDPCRFFRVPGLADVSGSYPDKKSGSLPVF